MRLVQQPVAEHDEAAAAIGGLPPRHAVRALIAGWRAACAAIDAEIEASRQRAENAVRAIERWALEGGELPDVPRGCSESCDDCDRCDARNEKLLEMLPDVWGIDDFAIALVRSAGDPAPLSSVRALTDLCREVELYGGRRISHSACERALDAIDAAVLQARG
jgi:hypothetical protein